MLAGKVIGEEVEGTLPWIVSQLLEGNNYTALLLRLDPQGGLGKGVGFFRKLWHLNYATLSPTELQPPPQYRESLTSGRVKIQTGLNLDSMARMPKSGETGLIIKATPCPSEAFNSLPSIFTLVSFILTTNP